MWPSCDNHTTTCHTGHLISCSPHWPTFVLRVPTLVSGYSGFICFIDVPFQASGPLDPCCPSPPNWRLDVCFHVFYSQLRPCLLHADSCHSYRYPLSHVPIVCLAP